MPRKTLTKRIEESQSAIKNDPRGYIGASIIGSECLRQIWYDYKGIKSNYLPPKSKRTFDIGKTLEGLVLQWVKDAQFKVIDNYFTLNSDRVELFQGNIDALLFDEFSGEDDINPRPHAILEIKTAKDASFNIFIKKGFQLWNPQYYAQVQSYMGMSGINKAYVLVLNKDNSDLHDELVEFDERYYEQLEEKAFLIAKSTTEPPRISNSPLWYKCKLCKFNKECHI